VLLESSTENHELLGGQNGGASDGVLGLIAAHEAHGVVQTVGPSSTDFSISTIFLFLSNLLQVSLDGFL